MSTINELLKKIEGKLRVLKFTQGETHRVLDSKKEKAIARHAIVFEDLIGQTHQLEVQVQQSKIENGDAQEEVTKWTLDIKNENVENFYTQDRNSHTSVACDKVVDVASRKKELAGGKNVALTARG